MLPPPRSKFVHWQALIALNLAIMAGFLIYKAGWDKTPPLPYVHLLVDYHFGFIKRALIGMLLSSVTNTVPTSMVFVLGGVILFVTAVLFIRLFDRTFGLSRDTVALLVFVAGSPFFFKNYIRGVGYFDIYGCAFALILLLIPARSFAYVIVAASGSAILLLIHHIHMLLFIPIIAAIVVIRYYLTGRATRVTVLAGILIGVALILVFLGIQFYGGVPVPQGEFLSYLQSRAAPGRAQAIPAEFVSVWYNGILQEIRDTWDRLPSNLLSVPFYIALIALHAPFIRYFCDCIRELSWAQDRRIVLAIVVLISVGYLVIFATVYDYARWISNWAVCMALMLFAVKQLPAAKTVAPIPLTTRTFALAAALTLIPEVGIRQAWH